MKKNVLKGMIAVLVLALLAFGGWQLYRHFAPQAVAGAKTVTLQVTDDIGNTVEYVVHTDAEYLQQVMDEADGLTYHGEENTYGIMIDTINGLVADYNENGAYWGFFVNGEYCNYGITEQPVADGDVFAIVYTVG